MPWRRRLIVLWSTYLSELIDKSSLPEKVRSSFHEVHWKHIKNAIDGKGFAIVFQSQCFFFSASLVLYWVKVVAGIFRVVLMLNLVQNRSAIFVEKLNITRNTFVLRLVLLIFIDRDVSAENIWKG